jgi:mRNA interferase HicA
MKRRDLLRHLEKHGCEFLREGGNHTIYVNRRAQKSSAIQPFRDIARS